jgi:predicted ferric reductase
MSDREILAQNQTQSIVDGQSTLPIQDLLLTILVVVAGVLFALNILPMLLPGMAFSVTGDAPKVYWFMSRGSAIAAYWVLWLSMSSGVIITNKMAQRWPGIPPAYEIHQYTSLLGLGLALFHAMILMGDQYIHYNLVQVFLPFGSENYRPTWVGFGQVAFYLWALVNLSFYVRKRIGKKAWRLIHFLSYVSLLGAMLHAIFSGTDSTSTWTQALYIFSGVTLTFLTVYRVLIARFPPENPKARRPVPPSAG